MECACGGSTGALQEARNKRLDAVLTYQACLACGRVSGDRLRIGTTLVLTGPRARCEFNTLDQERADALKTQAERPAETPVAVPWGEVEVGETATLF